MWFHHPHIHHDFLGCLFDMGHGIRKELGGYKWNIQWIYHWCSMNIPLTPFIPPFLWVQSTPVTPPWYRGVRQLPSISTSMRRSPVLPEMLKEHLDALAMASFMGKSRRFREKFQDLFGEQSFDVWNWRFFDVLMFFGPVLTLGGRDLPRWMSAWLCRKHLRIPLSNKHDENI